MYWFTKDGKEINRATYEFWGDTDADILSIPKREYVPYSFGIALNEGAAKLWICDSDKVWYCTGAWSAGEGGSGYDDTLLRAAIEELQEKIDEVGNNVDAIQEIINNYGDKLLNIESRLTALENKTPTMDGECNCVQHSILDGNWDGTFEDKPDEPEEPVPDDPVEELTTWDLFVKYCAENYNDNLIGYQIVDDGPAAHTFNIVNLEQKINAEDGKTYDCVVLQNSYAVYDDVPFDAPEAVLANGNYEESLFYYKAEDSGYKLMTDYEIGSPIEGNVYVNSVADSTGEVIAKGSNDWETSFIRQFLNKTDAKKFALQHIGDVLPDVLPKATYLESLSDDLVKNIMPIKNLNVIDKVVLPSIAQMNGISSSGGKVFSYWKTKMKNISPTNNANANRATKTEDGTVVFTMLLDADEESKHKRAYIMKGSSAGKIGYSSAMNLTASMPVFYIAIREAN